MYGNKSLFSKKMLFAAIATLVLGMGTLGFGWPSQAAIPDPNTFAPAQESRYQVQPGDTLFSLAKRFHTDVKTLMQLNLIADPTTMKIGTTLRLPPSSPATAAKIARSHPPAIRQAKTSPESFLRPLTMWARWLESSAPSTPSRRSRPVAANRGTSTDTASLTFTHTVASGETPWALAIRYGQSLESLYAANPGLRGRELRSGEQIRIPQGALPVAAFPGIPAKVVEEAISVIPSTLTAYGPGFASTGKQPGDPDYGITSIGVRATVGRTVAVDPTLIPYGSRLYIPGIGYRIAEDTGSAIKGQHIDVFFATDAKARQFGVRHQVPVYLLQLPTQ
ncbi:MAG: LysM peptidoglycan-binding domain-containing protein [Firmicutes bacterium]|nr:LysM peptidoglycan-binding domain-containing protein [Bacillota bacterium]